MKTILIQIIVLALLIFGTVGQCFADSCTVPVHINVAETTVSFSVTEKVNMTSVAGVPDLVVDSLVIQNTGTMGQICLSSLTVTAENGWKLVEEKTDFINMSANAKKFSLAAEGRDFSIENTIYPSKTARVGEKITLNFSGKTGASTETVSDFQVARIVATVSLV